MTGSETPVGRPAARPAPGRVDAVAEWRSSLARFAGFVLLFEIVSGLVVYVAPFGRLPQTTLLVHVVVGVVTVPPLAWYLLRHWLVRRHGRLTHYQALGYLALVFLVACIVSGFVGTWQGFAGPRLSPVWDAIHLVSSVAFLVVITAHLVTVLRRRIANAEAIARLASAQRGFWVTGIAGCALLLAACGLWATAVGLDDGRTAFPASYDWTFGRDRPFAPSLARTEHGDLATRMRARVVATVAPERRAAFVAALDEPSVDPIGFRGRVQRAGEAVGISGAVREQLATLLADAEDAIAREGAIAARHLAGSASCGTTGCHEQIYDEWLPSAHRYSSMDDMFQRVQSLMAIETSPEQTRYCAGCHDPISLFSGAKNADNVTLSALGADEGASCLVCHSIVQTDVQGNGDFTLRVPNRYVYELHEGRAAKVVSDFLIRTYPKHHVTSYARPLYKTPEFCGACHKQYLDKEVNTDIGKVQGQNQYDSWKNSRWYHEGDPTRTVSCRECHMPLEDSADPARGDATDYNRTLVDGQHRSHRMLASNQYIPIAMNLEGGVEHVALTEQWLRGEYPIPEIADKWVDGPVVRMDVLAPESAAPGEQIDLRVTLLNHKTGHDFPTGPLDMIESWVEITVTDDDGKVIHRVGALNDAGEVTDAPLVFKALTFDRRGDMIDRHNLWDLVGASYKRSIYPGVTDTASTMLQCPSLARGRVAESATRDAPGMRTDDFAFAAPGATGTLHVRAVLWYRKANPEFLNRVYGADSGIRAPATRMNEATTTIAVSAHPVALPSGTESTDGSHGLD